MLNQSIFSFELKERYITFNRRYGDNYKVACAALKELIRLYYDCPYPLFHEFEHLRNRFLFSQRKNASILAVPKTFEDACPKTGISRDPYKKKECDFF